MKLTKFSVSELCDTEKQIECVNGIIEELSKTLKDVILDVYRMGITDALVFRFIEVGGFDICSCCLDLDNVERRLRIETIMNEPKRMIESVKVTYLQRCGIIH